MIKRLIFSVLLTVVSLGVYAQVAANLEAKAFANKINEAPKAVLVDVRTSDEYKLGHLPNANNWDWKNGDFKSNVLKLNKTEPILLYCLSGARSDLAAKYLQEQGFNNITVLKGGILKWRSENLPELNEAIKTKGISLAEYKNLLKNDKLVLVDFYADWCIPCQQMKPYLDKIALNKKERVEVVRINIDQNPALAKTLGISELPVLQIYKNEKMIWEKRSLATEKELLDQIK